MGVTNYLSSGKFVERDSYLPEGWSKQVCSDSEGNGYISYMSPNGETFRSRKAVDEYLATLVEPAASVVEGNLQFDQQKESASINTVETGVVDNAINQESNESQNTLVQFTKDTPLEVVDSNNLQSFVVNSEIPSKKPELNAELSLEFDTDDDDSDDEVDDNQCNICGNIFDEDKGLILHVEDVHKDYYFDEDNSLLLKEDLVSKENSMSKCKLCLENFKNEDLQLHMKGLHPSDYLENEINDIHGGSEQNYGTKDSKNDEKESDIETNKIEETNEKRSLEVNDETDMDDDDEVDDNQCNICGKIFEEDKSLIIHVENIHKDYYFDEDNSLLLMEDLLSKENTVSKCKLCLENFKNEDLHQHMKGMHPTDYEETEINVFPGEHDITDMGDNLRKEDCEESDMATDGSKQTDGKQNILMKAKVYKPNQTENEKRINNIIIDDDENENESENKHEGENRLNPMFTEQETSRNHTLTDNPLKTFTAQEPIKTEVKLETLPFNIPTVPAKMQTPSGREAPYRCNLCDIKYYVRSHLQVHNERMHKKCKWKCDACLTVYANEAELVEHNATSQHEYRTRTLMASQNQKQTFQGPPTLKHPPTSYQLNQNAQSPMTLQPNQNAYKNPQPLLNRQPNQTVKSNQQLNQNAQPLSNQNIQTLSNRQPNQNSQSLLNQQPNQNAQNLLNKQPNQNAQYLSNQGLQPAQTSISHQLKGIPQSLDSNKMNPQGNFQQANNGHTSSPQLNSDKWNPQGDISQLNPDKWNPQGTPATQTNTEYNPPQFVPQPRSKTYEPQDIKTEIKPILSQPNVPPVVKPAPPPSPPRPMDPVTKMHLAKVSQICKDLNLCDYPVPVNPSAKQIFRDPQAFGAYLLPLLMSVNPSAKMQDLAILGKAKWAQLLESQTGAMEPPAQNNGMASVVNTAGLVQHMQHLQILQSIGQH